jgi:2-polyprenyl-6-methoxyphenol hydroxylase-like FAD-dependent oxidoreductase
VTAARVIVAGAGPVGLTAALALAQAGVSVTLVEKRAALNTVSKASTFHPPTIEILDRMGVAAVLRDRGQRVERIQYRTAEGGVFAEFDLNLLARDTPFPLRIHLEQSSLTPAILAELGKHRGAEIRFDTEAIAVERAEFGVNLMVRGSRGAERIAGAYLIAADGARSQVRAALGIGFDGAEYGHRVLRLMTDEDLTRRLADLAPISYLHNGDKSASFLKMPDCWRIILRVPAEVEDSAALDEAWILDRLREAFPGWDRVPHTVHKDVYGASKRLAQTYRVGRVVLAGDAAHLTNTRGGMNMNAGIHDADAIARAMVASLRADDPGLVARAADERRRIAAELLIPRTDRTVMGGPDWLDHIRKTAADPAAARAYLLTSAMLDMVERPAMAAAA